MKTTIAILLLAISVGAGAKTVLKMPNDAGGYIYLDTSDCRQNGWSVAYTRIPGGKTVLGCWKVQPDTGLVFVDWMPGGLMTYPSEWFRPVDVK